MRRSLREALVTKQFTIMPHLLQHLIVSGIRPRNKCGVTEQWITRTSRVMTGFFWLLATGYLLLGTAHAASLDADKDKPIEITADSLEVLQPNRTATFRGNVHAKQGNVVLKAQQMIVHYRVKEDRAGDVGAVSKIDAAGSVVLTTPEDTAKGDSGTYLVDSRLITLSGNVTLTRGKNVLQGSRVEYSFETGKSLLTSAPIAEGETPGRVRALFTPEDKPEGKQ